MGLDKKEIDMVILGLLMGAPMHGYMLKQTIEGSYGDRYFKLSNSAMYPTLAKLEKAGYIEGKRQLQEAVPDRKVYYITEAGKKKFVELVATPVEPSSTPGMTDFSFMVHAVHFGFITKEERRRVTMPLYEDAKLELKNSLTKKAKFDADLKTYQEVIEKNPRVREQYGNIIGQMVRFPKFVLYEGIEDLEKKVRFYEKLMELD